MVSNVIRHEAGGSANVMIPSEGALALTLLCRTVIDSDSMGGFIVPGCWLSPAEDSRMSGSWSAIAPEAMLSIASRTAWAMLLILNECCLKQ